METVIKNNDRMVTVFLPKGDWDDFMQFVFNACVDYSQKPAVQSMFEDTMENWDDYMDYLNDLTSVTSYTKTLHEKQSMVVGFNNNASAVDIGERNGSK